MSRVVWKGAIVFGLVHVPVDLYPGAKANDLDLDWIDRRDLAPVGYRRVNKVTGKTVEMSDIAKGYAVSKGRYVLLDATDFEQANPKATQTIEIVAFVDAGEIDPAMFETPYRLAPGKRGEKGYALLRETLKATKRVGIAQVVIRAKQHLAAVLADGDALRLLTLRYADEILDPAEFELPAGGRKSAGVGDRELALAKRLVDDMTEPWKPESYRDTYRNDLLALIRRKEKQGKAKDVKEVADAEPSAPRGGGAQVIDLMAALQKSLGNRPGRKPAAKVVRAKASASARAIKPTLRPSVSKKRA
jgi:DNA end-binding protein Ku